MSEAKVVKEIAAPAQQVFEALCSFTKIKAGGSIEAIRYEGEGIGMQRFISMASGTVVERLDVYNTETMTMSYTIVNDDSPLPFKHYSATVVVSDNRDKTSTVEWTGTFEAVGDEAIAIRTATGIYAGAIKSTRLELGL